MRSVSTLVFHKDWRYSGLLEEENRIAEKLGLTKQVRKRAEKVSEDAIAMRLVRGKPPSVLAAASLYVGCREHHSPVTLRDLAAASGSTAREVGRCYSSLLKGLDISRPAVNGMKYVNHLAAEMRLPLEAAGYSQEIIKGAAARGLNGRNPMTLAAAAVYLACLAMGKKVTQAEIADAAGVGEVSVRECCKTLRSFSAVLPAAYG